jgi:hypothetical protein
MKHFAPGVIVLTLFLGVTGTANGQEGPPSATSNPSSGRSSYDPMAHGKNGGQPNGIVETALAGVNPQDKNYGQVIGDWRKEIFENTIRQIYFWGLLALGMGLGCSVAANGWLMRERRRRLAISADIVTQLYNAYVGSRAKALEVINKYNSLVDRYNRLDNENILLKSGIAEESADKTATPSGFEVAKSEKPEEQISPLNVRIVAAGEDKHEELADGLGSIPSARVEELEVKLRRKEAQLQAKDNQITNLRGRLTRAHDSLESERKQKSGAV